LQSVGLKAGFSASVSGGLRAQADISFATDNVPPEDPAQPSMVPVHIPGFDFNLIPDERAFLDRDAFSPQFPSFPVFDKYVLSLFL
jgi:hypothetical protein